MRLIKGFIFFIVIIGALGFGVYHFGMNFISNKIADSVTSELENEANLDSIQTVISSNPEIQSFVEEGANVDDTNLPFTTTEEAANVIIQKVGVSELQNMYTQYQNGMSEKEAKQLVKQIEGKLTEKEILALKAIAYKELNK